MYILGAKTSLALLQRLFVTFASNYIRMSMWVTAMFSDKKKHIGKQHITSVVLNFQDVGGS